MLPFRHLLSSKVPFQWSPDLELAFQKSKQEIVRLCEKGIRSFNPALPTALATDWSKYACGLWLCQKHCSCDQTPAQPGCCAEGWQTVFCSSSFNNPAESRYAPIEGECRAAAWAMDKCKFFLLGLPEFTLCVDHKPLISILGDKELCDIPNPRLLREKEKTLMFRFKPVHVAGKDNVVPDCWSRRQDSPIATDPRPAPAALPSYDISNILPGYQDHLGPPSWVSSPTTDNSPIISPLDPAASLQQSVGSTVPGPGLQGGLGEVGLVGTATLSGPSPPRGSGVPIRRVCDVGEEDAVEQSQQYLVNPIPIVTYNLDSRQPSYRKSSEDCQKQGDNNKGLQE